MRQSIPLPQPPPISNPKTPLNLSPSTSSASNPPLKTKFSLKRLPKFKQFFKRLSSRRTLKIAALILTPLLGLFLLALFLILLPARKFAKEAQALLNRPAEIKQSLASKDLEKIKAELDLLRLQTNDLEKDFQKMKTLRFLPRLSTYYHDGETVFETAFLSLDSAEILIKAVEPYQDFLGLTGTATDSGQTTQDRIDFLVQSVEGILPHLDELQTKTIQIEEKLSQIDANRYPEEFRGLPLRSSIIKAQDSVTQANVLIKDGRPLIEKTAWLLGKDEPRHYFLIFQNDAELRPTGGFWTAYGILKLDNGQVSPELSEDIYALDSRFDSSIPAPRPIKDYHIKVPYLNLRDINLSPDFPTSVQAFLEHYQKLYPKQQIDAVIAIDTQVLVNLVKIMGRIGVPGWGNFTPDPDDRCWGCPQIIYQLEELADKPLSSIVANRKGFLAPLMHSLLANAMGSPKEKIAPLATSLVQDLTEKHLLIYFPDPDLQQSISALNFAGTINETNSDYFFLVDSNMAGAKTNMFLNQEIKHEIKKEGDKIKHKVTVTYENPHPASNCNLEKGDLCLNASKYRNWFRFYVPQGSTLEKMIGSEVEPLTYEESGKTVFEGFYGDKYPLYAQSSSRVTIEYQSSVSPDNYSLLIQKQPGSRPPAYKLLPAGKPSQNFNLKTDKKIQISW